MAVFRVIVFRVAISLKPFILDNDHKRFVIIVFFLDALNLVTLPHFELRSNFVGIIYSLKSTSLFLNTKAKAHVTVVVFVCISRNTLFVVTLKRLNELHNYGTTQVFLI